MKIIHITNWYPNTKNPKEALWIQNHIDSLEMYTEGQQILHIEVKPSKKLNFIKKNNVDFIQRILYIPLNNWFLIEVLTSIILCYYLLKLKVNQKFDVINFHIAYPLLTYWHIFKKIFKVPIIITEHWSAYHFNFGVKKLNKLKRIKRIFHQNISVITISQALKKDIQKFSGNSFFPTYVIPNIVHKEFLYDPFLKKDTKTFFMISNWKWPKKPEVVIEAFATFLKGKGKGYTLRIGGYGSLLVPMKRQVEKLKMKDHVFFLGTLESQTIAFEMKRATAFLHCSDYETFSVVCAEALTVGCPLVASDVGGIKELVKDNNGILVKNNTVSAWVDVLNRFGGKEWDKEKIANEAATRFNIQNVGLEYYKVLSEVVGHGTE